MADLAKGQLVRDERCSMMDLMSAIEINDARTDTYLHSQKERQRQSSLPSFDPAVPLHAQDVVWLHDEVLRLEATFHAGYPLASTLWTCNYLRADSLAAISGFAPSTSASADDGQSQLRTVVVRALFLGVLKSSQIVWEELGKNQVYEHEDVHLSRGSLSFNSLMSACYAPSLPPSAPASPLVMPGQGQDESPQPPERLISVDDVLRDLDAALRWLQAEEQVQAEWLSAEMREKLVARVTLRIDLLYPIALLTYPAHTSPSAISHHLDRLESYSSLFPTASTPSSSDTTSYDPPPVLRAAFHPSATVPLLATQQPPRPVDILPLDAAYDLWRRIVSHLGELMGLWELWRKGEGGWKELHEWSRRRARVEAQPYVRSVQQSLISTPTHLFHVKPISSLATSFLTFTTPLPSSFTSTLPLLLSHESHPSQPAHTLLAFLERLSAKLAQFAHALAGQNRGRQRRWVIKSLGTWDELVCEAAGDARRLVHEVLAAVEYALPEGDAARVRRAAQLLRVAVSAHAHELALETLLSGFEEAVGLFGGGGGPSGAGGGAAEAWWVGTRVARRLATLWDTLVGEKDEGEGGRDYLEAKSFEARAIEAVCAASWLVSCASTSSRPPPKFSSPFLPSLAFPPAQAAQGRFRQRFEWLGRLSRLDGAAQGSVADWAAYREERDRLDEVEVGDLASRSEEACERAILAVTALERVLPALSGTLSPFQVTQQHDLGPLSCVPSAAFDLPDSPKGRSLSSQLRRLGMHAKASS
ncbi:uncharacterized protein RHOBADRAFT_52745 [Rhodotorula graminis WP1]|uniref:NAA35-like N-terminal domain-containing protein n=1 Tax=Rhodotorula graminis (strain WP1) TaxID=578459 RepID=A0A194S8H9_RHOGW|nr:uncharacterized protein RHOBADRAFT_52745 [Rhodotorula graminis WP1]KPV75711.1 hypothetical protein RHOBADRAFT_52745 [Rhodotorula graminis WP1]